MRTVARAPMAKWLRIGAVVGVLVAVLSISAVARAETGYLSTRFKLGSTFNKRGGGSMELQRNFGSSTSPDWKVIKTYSEDEFNALERETNGVADCLSVASSSCAASAKAAVQGMTPGEADGAQSVITALRSEGSSLDQGVVADMLGAGEQGGTLLTGAGGLALGGITLGPLAFKLGVDIGNGIDQLFGLPTLEAHEEREATTAAASGCSVKYEPGPSLPGKSDTGTEPVKLEPGKYVVCGGSIALAERARVLPKGHTTDCDGFYFGGAAAEQPGVEWVDATNCDYGTLTGEDYLARQEVAYHHVNGECRIEDPENPKSESCVPVGLPNVGLLTPAQEEENTEHGKPGHPEEPETSKLPSLVPLPADEGVTKKMITSHDPTREKFEKDSEPSLKELGEEEEKERKKKEEEEGLVIPSPEANEPSAHYISRLRTLGFTNPVEQVLPLTSANPRTGPGDVAYTSPSSGTRVNPETVVVVETNPEDSPAPAGGGGTPFGVNIPEIKLPHLAAVCKNFPFGVPCWLVEEFAAWSATSTTPNFTIDEYKVKGHKIGPVSVSLEPLEPIMTKVRPFMILFATIGLVLLFYRFAVGGSPGSGGGGDSADLPSETSLDE